MMISLPYSKEHPAKRSYFAGPEGSADPDRRGPESPDSAPQFEEREARLQNSGIKNGRFVKIGPKKDLNSSDMNLNGVEKVVGGAQGDQMRGPRLRAPDVAPGGGEETGKAESGSVVVDQRTGFVKGFKSKDGREFEAKVVMGEDWKVGLEF